MGKARRKPEVPAWGIFTEHGVTVDRGPDTAAQRSGAVLEQRSHRGQAVKGKRREHPLDILRRAGTITEAQRDAGLALLDAWCACRLSPEQSGIFVDSTPDFDALAIRAAERNFRWSALIALVPGPSRHVIGHVVLDGNTLDSLHGYYQRREDRSRTVNKGLADRYKAELIAGLQAIVDGT